jgi:hypothetical protein
MGSNDCLKLGVLWSTQISEWWRIWYFLPNCVHSLP